MTFRTPLQHPISRALTLSLALTGCADAGDPAAKKPTSADTPANGSAAPSEPADPPVEAPTTKPVEATEATAPPIPTGPPRLSVAVEGHTTLGLDLVGERAMISRRGELHALGRDGKILESYARAGDELAESEVIRAGGRDGGSVFMIVNTGGRGDYLPVLAFYDDGAWKRPRSANDWVTEAWPWIDASTLAMVMPSEEGGRYRLAVVRGAPKAPKLDALWTANRCADDPSLAGTDVDGGGSIALVFACTEGLWAWSWRPGDEAGEAADLKDRDGIVRSVDVRGERVAIATDGERPQLHERDAAGWHHAAPPGKGTVVNAIFDPSGVLHYARGTELQRRDGAGWADASPPGEGAILRSAGVDVGVPWVLREHGLHTRRGDTWEAVEIPPAAFVAGHRPRVASLLVSPSGQAWILGEFFAKQAGRTVASHFYSVVTSGAIGQPLRIGEILGHDLTRDEAPEPGMNRPTAAELAARTPIGPTPWPRTPSAECRERLVLLVPGSPTNRAGDYKGARKQLRGRNDLAGARFVELELGSTPIFAAIVADDAAAEAMVAVGRKINKWRSPEIACGDPSELEAAQVKVLRELKIDLATGEVIGP